MNSSKFKPGDVLQATHRELKKGCHPIIYLSGHTETDFVGAMLTHHEDQKRNVKISADSFVKQEGYNGTYLVIGKFIKPEEWGPFCKINQLTEDGLNFVYDVIGDLSSETFANYFRRNSNKK
jgi:hypothetical protein